MIDTLCPLADAAVATGKAVAARAPPVLTDPSAAPPPTRVSATRQETTGLIRKWTGAAWRGRRGERMSRPMRATSGAQRVQRERRGVLRPDGVHPPARPAPGGGPEEVVGGHGDRRLAAAGLEGALALDGSWRLDQLVSHGGIDQDPTGSRAGGRRPSVVGVASVDKWGAPSCPSFRPAFPPVVGGDGPRNFIDRRARSCAWPGRAGGGSSDSGRVRPLCADRRPAHDDNLRAGTYRPSVCFNAGKGRADDPLMRREVLARRPADTELPPWAYSPSRWLPSAR